MGQCPFWSNERAKFGCYKECPMNESVTGEECIFSLYLDKNLSSDEDESEDSNLVLCASN